MEKPRVRFRSQRISNFTESVIREMTRLAIQYKVVNLPQGFPDFGATDEIKRAAQEITVWCGATEGMIAALLAVTNPGDEVVIFEPYYENYGPDALLCDAQRKMVRLRAADWTS